MTEQISFQAYGSTPAANYERYFVPAIGGPLADDLVELADLRPGERILDLACGTGVVTRLAAQQVGGSSVVAVDVNPGMLDVARTTTPDPAIEWYQASAESLPLDDATFDVVICQMGLQFFPDKPAALSEIRRVLKPNGRIVLNAPGPTPPVMTALEQALGHHLGPEPAGFVATVFSLHEPDHVRRLLAAADFADAQARSKQKSLRLPAAEDFLWQYLYSTPLAQAAETLDEERRAELQQEFATGTAAFADNGGLLLDIDITSATARQA